MKVNRFRWCVPIVLCFCLVHVHGFQDETSTSGPLEEQPTTTIDAATVKERVVDAVDDKQQQPPTTTATTEGNSEEFEEDYIPRWQKSFLEKAPNDTSVSTVDNETGRSMSNINMAAVKELDKVDDDVGDNVGGNVDDNKVKKDKVGEKEENDEDEEGDEEDDDYEDEDETDSVCTAEYFLDKIIPKDYPTEITKEVHHLNETILRLNRMYNFSSTVLDNLNPFFREMASRFSDFVYESELDSECMAALFKVMGGLRERKRWAMSFFDSSATFLTGGFQEGKFVSFGEFDQCLDIESEKNERNEFIYGQYCLLKPIIPVPSEIKFKKGEKFVQTKIASVNRVLNDDYIRTYLELYHYIKRTILRLGICLPNKCSAKSVENAINKLLVRKTGLNVEVGPNCVTKHDDIKFDNYQFVALFFFVALGMLVLISTLYELIQRLLQANPAPPKCRSLGLSNFPLTSNSPTSTYAIPSKAKKLSRQMSTPYVRRAVHVQFLTLFSLIRNTRTLFQKQTDRLFSLDSLRLILIMFFFIINSYYYTLIFSPYIVKRFYVQGPLQFMKHKKYFFLRMYYLLDYFFVFAGAGLALHYKAEKFNYVRYVAKTYLNNILPIIFSIGLIFVVPTIGSGPLWHLFDETMTAPCRNNLWPTLLMYNNLNENFEQTCNPPSLLVSAVFQIKIIAPLFTSIAFCLHPQTGRLFLLLMFIFTAMMNVVPRYYFGMKIPYEFRNMTSFTEIKQSIVFYNFNSMVHLSSFIFGIFIGHLMRFPPKLSSGRTLMGWGVFTSISFIATIIYLERIEFANPRLSMFHIMSILTFGRTLSLGFFTWVLYACTVGRYTILNRFLSSIVFRPLARLSYGFYVTSIIVTCFRLFSIRSNITLDAQTMYRSIVSDAVVSFIISYLIHILLVQPYHNFLAIDWKQLFGIVTDDDCDIEVVSATSNQRHFPGETITGTISTRSPQVTSPEDKEYYYPTTTSYMIELRNKHQNLDQINNNNNNQDSSTFIIS